MFFHILILCFLPFEKKIQIEMMGWLKNMSIDKCGKVYNNCIYYR